MAHSNRLTKSYLADVTRDSTELYQESFTPLIRYLEANAPLAARVGYAISPKFDFVRFGQKPLVHFCPAAFCEVNFSPVIGEYKIKNSYFGLLGINGPLPAHFTEHAIERQFRFKDPTFSEFLDLFNHRFISLFYRAWSDAEPAVNYDRPNDDNFKWRLNTFSGDASDQKNTLSTGQTSLDHIPQCPSLQMVGLLSHKNRSGKVLIQILSGYLGVKVRLDEFQGRWYPINDSDLTRLGGANTSLGEKAIAGRQTFQRMFNFCILIGPLDYSQYIELNSSSCKLETIVNITHRFIGQEYDFSIKIYLNPQQTRPCRLGTSMLGLTSWCQSELGHLTQLEPRLACTREY